MWSEKKPNMNEVNVHSRMPSIDPSMIANILDNDNSKVEGHSGVGLGNGGRRYGIIGLGTTFTLYTTKTCRYSSTYAWVVTRCLHYKTQPRKEGVGTCHCMPPLAHSSGDIVSLG